MSFAARWTPSARAQFEELRAAAVAARENRLKAGRSKSSPQEGLYKQVRKAILLLAENPRHPGLQPHEFLSLENPYDPAGKVFDAYAQHRTPGAYRIFWCYGPRPGETTILAITPHP